MMTLSRIAAVLLRLGAIVMTVTPPNGSSLVSAFPLTPHRVTGNAIASHRCDDHGVDGHGRRRCPTLLLTRPPSWSSSSSSSSLSLLPPSLSSSSLEKTIHGSGTAMFLVDKSDTEDATDIPTLDQQQATINATVKVENSGGIVLPTLNETLKELKQPNRWLKRRSGIIASAAIAGAFSWYGVYGSIGILPFIPPMEKSTTLEDWRNLCSICAFLFAFPALFMSVDMQDDSIILQATIRNDDQVRADKSKKVERDEAAKTKKEDQDYAAKIKKDDQEHAAKIKEVDRELAANKTALELGFRKEDQELTAHYRSEDRDDRRKERREDQAHAARLRREDQAHAATLKREDRAHEERLRRDDRAHEERLRREDRKEKLEDRITALQRERNHPLVLPWDKKTIDDEIQLAHERLEKLQENEA